MKIVLTSFFIMLVSWTAMAQDLIVTQEGDSLNCRIIKERKDYVYAAYMEKGKAKLEYFYPALIKGKQKNFYKTVAIPSDVKLHTTEFGKLRLGIKTGWAHRLAKVEASNPAEKAYLKELKNGWSYSGEIDYFIKESVGVGIAANIFKSKNTIDGAFQAENDEWYPATFGDNQTIWYIGPSVSYESLSENEKHSLIFRYSLGYIHYNNLQSIKVFDHKFERILTGGSLGYNLDINYSYFFNSYVGVNANVALIAGLLTSITIKDDQGNKIETVQLEKEQYEGLGRLDISVGLVFVL